MGLSVVVLESDPKVAHSLAGSLRSHFHSVHLTHSRDELREKIARNRPEAVIFGIESSQLTDLQSLHNDFPSMPIVCTHRIPDEELWMAALDAGASDVCPSDDAQDVLKSVLRSLEVSRTAAA